LYTIRASTAGTKAFVNALLVDSSVKDSVHHESAGSNSSNDDANHAAADNSIDKSKSIEDNEEQSENSESISAKDKDIVKSSDRGRSINDNADQICWYCHDDVTRVEINRCAGCKKARYCSEECQKADWGRHGDYCLLMQQKIKKKTEERKAQNVLRG